MRYLNRKMTLFNVKNRKGFFLFLFIIALAGCAKNLWENPYDVNTTLTDDDWNVSEAAIASRSVTTRTISWKYTKGNISGFRIDRKASTNSEWSTGYGWVGAQAREWIDSVLLPEVGQVCSYRIVTLAGVKGSSGVVLSDSLQIPSPANLTLEKLTESTFRLSWVDRSEGEEAFVVDRKQGDGNWVTGIDTLEANSHYYIDFNAFGGKSTVEVSYRVSALYKAFRSLPATVHVNASLSAPTGLLVTPLSLERVKLEWNDVSTGEAGYRIERKPSGGDWELLALTDSGASGWTDPASTWAASPTFYRVASFNGIAQSYWIEGAIHQPSLNLSLEEIAALHLDFMCDATAVGNYTVESRGVCWSTIPYPIISDDHLLAGSDTGNFSCTIPNLPLATTFYIRAFASHKFGVVYSNEIIVTTPPVCGSAMTIHHDPSGGVAPVSKTVVYNTSYINGLPGKCFITSNLGASHEATSLTDATEESAGWFWQFNTIVGYKHDGITRTPNHSWPPINAVNTDWLPELDPCTNELGTDWRLPTYEEINAMILANSWLTASEMFQSALKFHCPGVLDGSTGQLYEQGNLGGFYTRSTSDEYWGYYLRVNPNYSPQLKTVYKTNAVSVRCVRDETSWKK